MSRAGLDLRRDLGEVDVVAERPSARARRLRGALPPTRTPLQVCKPRSGGYARAAARQGAFAVEFRELNGVFGAFAVLNAFGVPPEARDGRCTLRGRATRSNP